jgi:hypothetical protein
VARLWRTPAEKIAAPQLWQRRHKGWLITEPGAMLGDDGGPIAITRDLKRVGPFRSRAHASIRVPRHSSADVDRIGWYRVVTFLAI